MRRVVLLSCAFAVALMGCRAEATITIDVDAQTGAGRVTVDLVLDDEAVAQLGGPDALRLDDLTAAGWTVGAPAEAAGALSLTASKPFANPEQFAAVMDELTGPDGSLGGFTYERSRTFGRTTYRVDGTVDLSRGLEAFGDDELASLLGSPIGWDAEALEAELGQPLGDAFNLVVEVRLPGSLAASEADVADGRARWEPRLGGEPIVIRAVGRVDDRVPAIWAAVAIGASALLLLVLAVRALAWVRRRSERRGAPVELDRTLAGRVGEPVLVLGWHGVAIEPADPLPAAFGPFCREMGSRVSAQEISTRYREAVSGRLSATELWSAVGVPGDPRALSREYLSRFSVVPGVHEVCADAAVSGWTVAVAGNDVAVWNRMLRRRLGLDASFDIVVLSGEVGRRFPDPAGFEVLRRDTGSRFADMAYVDRSVAALDVARSLGMRTFLYMPRGHAVPGEHAVLRSLSELSDFL